jgi:3-oxoacyl-[acyl-carrier-protein] synthase-1
LINLEYNQKIEQCGCNFMRRIVVTGLGIISSIGNNKEEVKDSLYAGSSGITFSDNLKEKGLRSQIHGSLKATIEDHVHRKQRRFMGDGAAWNYIAMDEAVRDSGLTENQISNPRTGLIMGTGAASPQSVIEGIDTFREKGMRRVNPFMVTRTMASTNSAILSSHFGIKGVSYSISSACATSAHCIGNAYELIQSGKQDIVFAGGGEALHWTSTTSFDLMGALSTHYNETPELASRPFDVGRDGFVISGGGGVLVLEELQHALDRKAHIYAELVGYGATSDGEGMLQPSGEGAVRCMQQALETTRLPVDYINAHGTGTPIGDGIELQAMSTVFGDNVPRFSSTKSLTGHAIGASGVHEAVYSLLMLEYDFIAASANVNNPDPALAGLPLVTSRQDNAGLKTVLSNSFGFGGANASLIFSAYDE